MNKELKRICNKDINEISTIVKPYLPKYDISNFNQSVIYEEGKTIVYKDIKNDSNDVIGHKTTIKLYDSQEVYILKDEENSISLEKMYSNVREKAIIGIKNNNIYRYFSYSKGDLKLFIEELYNLNIDLDKYINSESIETSLKKLKSKNKTRKRA